MFVIKSNDNNMEYFPTGVLEKLFCFVLQDCAGVILYCAEAATKLALDAIQILGKQNELNSFMKFKIPYPSLMSQNKLLT